MAEGWVRVFIVVAAATVAVVVAAASISVAARGRCGDGDVDEVSARDSAKEKRRRAYYERGKRKSNLYDSVPLSYKGRLLSHISSKRARWYLRKGLGDKVGLGVELRFEPAAEATEHCKRQARKPKENVCVVCSESSRVCR